MSSWVQPVVLRPTYSEPGRSQVAWQSSVWQVDISSGRRGHRERGRDWGLQIILKAQPNDTLARARPHFSMLASPRKAAPLSGKQDPNIQTCWRHFIVNHSTCIAFATAFLFIFSRIACTQCNLTLKLYGIYFFFHNNPSPLFAHRDFLLSALSFVFLWLGFQFSVSSHNTLLG